jgi:hypothetical protein
MNAGKIINIVLVIYFIATVSFINNRLNSNQKTGSDSTIILPLGGNSWPTHSSSKSTYITNQGIINWNDKQVGFDSYLRIESTGSIKIN